MQDTDADIDSFPYKAEILFGPLGEHHLSLFGTDEDSVLSYVHHLSHDEDLTQDLLMDLVDTVPDDEVQRKFSGNTPESLWETLSYISDYPVERYEAMAQGLMVSERTVDDDGRTTVTGQEAIVGMVYNFGGDQKMGTVVQAVMRLFYEHRLYISLLSAQTGTDEDELRTILLQYEGEDGS